MRVVYSPIFLKHSMGEGHPECPERLTSILETLECRAAPEVIEPSQAKEEDLLLVHTKKHLESLRANSALRSEFANNLFSKDTYEIAKLSAGAVLDAALLSKSSFVFALVRPPGHHAGRETFDGFCYLNNVAFAVRKMQKMGNVKKVLVVDFDLHHGNGTQDIFKDDESVYYLSLNQDPSVTYPGSGFESENNSHIRNIEVHEGADEQEYLRLFENALKEAVETHKPELIAVSAGFDTFGMDTIGSRLRIFDSKMYNGVGRAIRQYGIPAFGALEGGYYLPALGENVFEFLSAFE
jgi:acetoin utilization deacetylase AcuC-like enzyme